MATCAVSIVKHFNFKPFYAVNQCFSRPEILSVRNYAARRGTRDRKAKVLKVLKKRAEERRAKEARAKEKELIPRISRRFNDSTRPQFTTDNIVLARFFKWKNYPFEEAVECHRETHHPTVYNVPNAPLDVLIELDMKAAKKNRYIDGFQRIVSIPYEFNHGDERSVLVFCKSPEVHQEALQFGAERAGGIELIKEIEKGEVALKDYDFVLCHPEILPEIVPIRGLMKKRFPNIRDGTLGSDMKAMVRKFLQGINYKAEKDQYEKDFASVETSIGTLDMATEHLRANLEALLKDLYSMKPKRPGPFITSLFLKSAPSVEKLKVDPAELLPELKEEAKTEAVVQEDSDAESDDEEGVEKKATA